MAAVSPTPMAGGLARRPSQRQLSLRRLPSRTALAREGHQPFDGAQPPGTGSAVSSAGKRSQQLKRQQLQHQSQQHQHQQQQQQQRTSFHNNDDSSEDEIPVPMKLSALTKALLSDGNTDAADKRAPASPPSSRLGRRTSQASSQHAERRRSSTSTHAHPNTDSGRQSRESSPVRKRVVRLSNTPQSLGQMKTAKRRSTSTSRASVAAQQQQQHQRPPPRSSSRNSSVEGRRPESRQGVLRADAINTPARGERIVRLRSGSSAQRGRVASAAPSSGRSNWADRSGLEPDLEPAEAPETAARHPANVSSHGSVSRYTAAPQTAAAATATRRSGDDNVNVPGSMRVKRVSKLPGSFLSGPARRGRRRQSDEAEANGEGNGEMNGDVNGDVGGHHHHHHHHTSHYSAAASVPEPARLDEDYANGIRKFHSGSPISGNAAARAIQRRLASDADLRASAAAAPSSRSTRPLSIASIKPGGMSEDDGPHPPPHQHQQHQHQQQQQNQHPSPRIVTLPALDQENRRHLSVKPGVDHHLLAEKAARRPTLQQQPVELMAAAAAAAAKAGHHSLDRKPLAALATNNHNNNASSPRRTAPPPPKMPVLEAASSTTAGAGAAAASSTTTTQAKQRRNVLRVNGKCYTRLDCLGRGGSAKVYRVTAENGNMFALKRVSLENADEMTVRGYRGEIDLLSRLSGVDRVIKLFDHELNSEKQVLTLLMEMGELDLNKLLTSRHNPEQARFDPVFVRFYWKEMLECLQSVHEHDIVHSDLKPANFVLVRGRLKLIDFGIANAIQTDQTVNVHRETQIGTPNYMSPESLLDANNPRHGGGGGAGAGGRFAAAVGGAARPKLMKLGKPSDVWSLGCILYQMVYGLPPFGHIANQMARCQAIINWDHDIEYPSRAMGGVAVPPSLLRTMRRCLMRDQHLRPTCDELLHDSDPFLYPVEEEDFFTGTTANANAGAAAGADGTGGGGGGGRRLPIDEDLLARIIQNVVARCRERIPTEAESLSVWPQAYWLGIKKAMSTSSRLN